MRLHIIVADDNDLSSIRFQVPTLGSGYLHKMQIKLWDDTGGVDQMVKFAVGEFDYRREEVVTPGSEGKFAGSNKRTWSGYFPTADLDEAGSSYQARVFRNAPLYVKHGEDITFQFVAANHNFTGCYIVFEAEFVAFYESVLNYDVMCELDATDAQDEDYYYPVLVPFSIKQGMVNIVALMEDNETGVNYGYLIMRHSKPGSMTGGSTFTAAMGHYGIIGRNWANDEAIAAGGSLRMRLMGVDENQDHGFPGLIGRKQIPMVRSSEGSMISFDWEDLQDTLDSIKLIIRIVAKQLYARRSLKAVYYDGTRVLLGDGKLTGKI